MGVEFFGRASYKYWEGGTAIGAGITSSMVARLLCDNATVDATPLINIATIRSIMHFVHHTATNRVEFWGERALYYCEAGPLGAFRFFELYD